MGRGVWQQSSSRATFPCFPCWRALLGQYCSSSCHQASTSTSTLTLAATPPIL